MHFHHKHDLAGCTDHHDDWPEWAVTILATLDRQGFMIMSANQDALDALADQLATLATDFAAAKDAQPAEEALDFSGVNAAVAQLQALVPAAPAPVVDPSAPADPNGVPVEDVPDDPAQPAADGTVPAQSIPSVPLA